MSSRPGSSLVTSVLALAAAVGVGVAGYSLMSSGGSCSSGLSGDATLVANEDKSGCCPLGHTETAEAVLVSNETTGSCAEPCAEKVATGECESVCPMTGASVELASNEASDGVKTCDGAAAEVALVADTAGECTKTCDGEAASVVLVADKAGECTKTCDGASEVLLVADKGECSDKAAECSDKAAECTEKAECEKDAEPVELAGGN